MLNKVSKKISIKEKQEIKNIIWYFYWRIRPNIM